VAVYTLVTPADVKFGKSFPLSVTGATGGGTVTFFVGGSNAGSVSVNSAGKASINTKTYQLFGSVKIEARWTKTVNGITSVQTLSTTVAIR
jgi:hypothetical protein